MSYRPKGPSLLSGASPDTEAPLAHPRCSTVDPGRGTRARDEDRQVSDNGWRG